MKNNNIEGKVFFDFFSGTSNVGKFFKEKDYQVISSDLLYFSYVLQKAYIANNSYPNFYKLIPFINIKSALLFTDNYELVIQYLNNLKGCDGFISQNYAPSKTQHLEKPRMYFTNDNAKKIDAIRIKIEEWKNTDLIIDCIKGMG
jgi:adenine-specific DNA-methyltransferase